jgi:putative redox protein
MTKMTMTYEGDLRVRTRHELSGAELITDAPPDNQGMGRSFSPTDLTAASLGTCMITLMGIVARRRDIDLSGLSLTVTKEMITEPVRRIGVITIDFEMPAGIADEDRTRLVRAAEGCPVIKSLHPDVKVISNYNWK